MKSNNPNRIKRQVGSHDQILQKKSGDQHLAPQDESQQAAHRPHRLNREDMQKIEMPGQGEEET